MGFVRSRFWVSACVALTACSTGVSNEPPAKQAAPEPKRPVYREHQSVAPAPKTLHHDAVPVALLEQVLADAAKRAGVETSKLEVVSTEKLTWSDGSLGCAQPDRMYTQALVPGYRIWVRAASSAFDYHAAEAGTFVLCPAAQVAADEPAAR